MPNKKPQELVSLSFRDAVIGVSLALASAVALVATLVLLTGAVESAGAADGGVGTATGDGGRDGGGSGKPAVFPIPARHTYGDGFGAGRNHQGQDVFAKCGKPLLAVKRGRIQTRAWHSSAGHYVVLDVRGSTKDFAYMHLKRRAKYREGKRVGKGELIGRVGETGNAVGCHLHFEKWSGPGYYEGGRALRSVTKTLKKWDSWS